MFCPRCRYEYKSGILVCPDCGEDLVEKLPKEAEEPNSDTSFVPLPNLPGRVYAEMVKGALEKRGIPCFIRSEGVGDAYQFSGTTPRGGVYLFVPEDRLQECLEIQHQMLNHI
jgi:hypothetical protein